MVRPGTTIAQNMVLCPLLALCFGASWSFGVVLHCWGKLTNSFCPFAISGCLRCLCVSESRASTMPDTNTKRRTPTEFEYQTNAKPRFTPTTQNHKQTPNHDSKIRHRNPSKLFSFAQVEGMAARRPCKFRVPLVRILGFPGQ